MLEETENQTMRQSKDELGQEELLGLQRYQEEVGLSRAQKPGLLMGAGSSGGAAWQEMEPPPTPAAARDTSWSREAEERVPGSCNLPAMPPTGQPQPGARLHAVTNHLSV